MDGVEDLQHELGKAEETIARLAVERDDALVEASQANTPGNGSQRADSVGFELEKYSAEVDALKHELNEKNERIGRLTQRLIEIEGL